MTKVYVGMSGGVDSSLAAALLVEQGYQVTGVFMKNWTRDLPGAKCPWANDLADAKRVAVQLGIDFKVFDFESKYKHKVVDYMIDEYQAGRTPNPDIMCNQEIKFKLFLETALEQGADMIATGHYARIQKATNSQTRSTVELKKAVDENKDQTYFLYRVTGKALKQTLFPIGDYTKAQVRAMAAERHIYTANKKDSQGICFVGQVGIRDFLSQYVEAKPGDIIDQQSGKILGRHDGAVFYTLGQRHGLDVGGGLPYYVVGKDMAKNEIYITTDLNSESLWRTTVKLHSTHWINQAPINGTYDIRIRHRAPFIKANLTIHQNSQEINLVIDQPQRAITAGQSTVIYDGEVCLGGGIVI